MIGLDVTHQALLTPADRGTAACDRAASGTSSPSWSSSSASTTATRTAGTARRSTTRSRSPTSSTRTLVTTRRRNVEVELESELCRGRTVVDLWQSHGAPANAHVGRRPRHRAVLRAAVERIARLVCRESASAQETAARRRKAGRHGTRRTKRALKPRTPARVQEEGAPHPLAPPPRALGARHGRGRPVPRRRCSGSAGTAGRSASTSTTGSTTPSGLAAYVLPLVLMRRRRADARPQRARRRAPVPHRPRGGRGRAS